MDKHLQKIRNAFSDNRGITLVELVVTVIVLGIVLLVVNQVFFSTTRIYGSTSTRANQQMNARAGVSVMITELRPAGSDPAEQGIQGVLAAQSDTVHVQADLSGDGAIQTAEPSEDIMYFYDAGTQAVMRDPGTGPEVMIPNVTACAFTYFDVNNQPLVAPLAGNQLELVRSIGIDITTQTDQGGQMTVSTRVALRNG
ncbi:MAG: prepilin-type N-terminal cleavage/methylation domain-containing protein [Candidatus Latescibacteria bacterium]|nr:prepilin-type N-terminal cleavage/methylation domain-containing protein [Candidatus Latescibacterota bacterium]